MKMTEETKDHRDEGSSKKEKDCQQLCIKMYPDAVSVYGYPFSLI